MQRIETLPPVTEAQFQNRTIQLAKGCGWRVYHTHDSRRSEAGFPDLVLVKGSVIAFVELKSERGKVSPEQTTWMQILHDAACHPKGRVYTRVWRPHDTDEIEAFLTEKGR
jgi:hypothetical protein